MLFSYNWLRELVPTLDADARELMRRITIQTAESEGVEAWGAHFNDVVAARVLSVEPIEGSHNVKALVDTGRYGHKQVVCGAPNCREGLLTAYVPSGVTLLDKDIRKAVIAGVESDGMLASPAELGINADHEGVLELSALEPGAAILKPDFIIEIDNKSLTHRPDLWGHVGMAREVAAITGHKLQDPVDLSLLPAISNDGYPIEIEDYNACTRFTTLIVDNVTVQDSPYWLQARLNSVGMNAISNIVDITNYIAAELPKPMHAFDRDKLRGGKIIVRWAREGESLLALNEETYALDPSILVVADAEGPVGIAGIIGGMDSAVTAETKNILFESANFHAGLIRKTSTKLKLRTDASMRFEKAIDPENDLRSMARAIALLKELSPQAVVGKLSENASPRKPIAAIPLPLEWLNRKLGTEVPKQRVIGILTSLEFRIDDHGNSLEVTPPTWRATKDISLKEDLVEEIGRMIEYGSIPSTPPLVPSVVPPSNTQRVFFNQLRRVAADQGFDEVYNYSFISNELAERYSMPPATHLRVENPIASDLNLMRRSLVPRIGENIAENRKHFDAFQIFEIGREVHPKEDGVLPQETPVLIAAAYRKQDDKAECINTVKLLANTLLPGMSIEPGAARAFEHPARCGDIHWRGEYVGRVFELHPDFVEQGRAAIVEINLERLQALQPPPAKYKPVRRVPGSAFDLSVLVQPRDLAGKLQAIMLEAAGPLCEGVEFLYDYALPDGTRSVSFRLLVADPQRTLSSEEVSAIRNNVIERVKAAGYGFRG